MLPSLGPMALRSQAHAGVPPPALALRGGSLSMSASEQIKLGSGAVVRSTPRRDGPSGSRAEPWPSFLAKLSVGRRLALLSTAGLPEAYEIDRLQQHGWETAFAGDVAQYVAGEWE